MSFQISFAGFCTKVGYFSKISHIIFNYLTLNIIHIITDWISSIAFTTLVKN